ncbi:FtsK/SpoIIIE domain-containing protein [Heyndrickxia oleronia]|uniref:FtsK/SpoIIIE domain-containing protein n=1 Tax=Heyndrickxia oleronia TaxID=38875 RepID=UPI00203C2BC8|nr:FtsK/SpoIIIE domain-containing protein [Heyndrickxia oleronia]MCM3456554.1 FtsK/SpoIIIE domain-containing protein [Heyndrickxia oleronia]
MTLKEYFFKQKIKSKLLDCFRSSGLFFTNQRRNRTKYIYPKIHAINHKEKEKITEITFTLLNGMDPKEVSKKEFVFQQYFGKSIDIDGDLKKYVLTVYESSMPKELKYNFDDIQQIIAPFKLGIICGKDRNGKYIAFDLLNQPHILIAGETGSGKSTQLRSILTTLIKSKRPNQLRLFLADCKKSEFHIFRKVEHVECVLSKPKDIKKMLYHIKKELDERSDLTETFEVSHVDELPKEYQRPYLVVCIDEFVMLRKDNEIMDILTELVAIGRTLGVFAILSMQRPNAQVLDTTIRANLTVSMGFKLRDKTESRIVNTPGADKIECSGSFIMNSDKLYELQAPYLTMETARKLLNPFYVAKEGAKMVYDNPPQQEEKKTIDDINLFL